MSKTKQIKYKDDYDLFIWPGINSFIESINEKELRAAIIDATISTDEKYNFIERMKILGWIKQDGKFVKQKYPDGVPF